jgi:hypothetical protein
LLGKPQLSKVLTVQKAFKAELCVPIVNKQELDNLPAEDPRHYQLVDAPDGAESNSLNYHPRLQ